MFGSSLPPVVCRRAHVLFTLFVYSGVQYILCFCFVLFFFVVCAPCFQFLCIVNFWLPLLCSLKFLSDSMVFFLNVWSGHVWDHCFIRNWYSVFKVSTCETTVLLGTGFRLSEHVWDHCFVRNWYSVWTR